MAILKPDATIVTGGVPVNEYFLTKHNPNGIDMPTAKLTEVIGVTIHNTDWIKTAAGTTPAEQYTRATVNGNMNDVRVHFYVDDVCAWQNLPLDLTGWHAADGGGNGNRKTVAIECIMSAEYNDRDRQSEDNAARLAAALLKRYGLGIDALFTHTHWLNVKDGKTGSVDQLNTMSNSYKNCPLYILPHWSEFKAKVAAYLEDNDTSATEEKPVPQTKPKTKKLYRVRKSWDDAKSQIGAYENLDNAKKACTSGYTVYDDTGRAIFTNAVKSYAKGTEVTLKDTTLYTSAYAESGSPRSGTYFLYDGMVVKGRMRITNDVKNCGNTPVGYYVTGWVNKADYILTKSISRFARNTVDCLKIARDLKDKGIFIYFEKERIDTGKMDSELMLSIFSSFAAEESISISENEKWAIRKRFQDGTYKQSYLPYGYVKNENGEMIPDKREAEIVRWIFELAVNGHSTHSICKILRERNIPTRKGGAWSTSTIRDMLTNEKYTGDALFQKTYTDSSFRRHETKSPSKQIFIENHHEAIISREVFEKANQLLQQRAVEKGIVKGQGKYQVRYALSGIIVCGECGGTFKRRIHDHGSEIAWACATHIDDIRKCSMKYVRDDVLKAAITTMINKLIFGRKLIIVPYLAELKNCNANSEEIVRLKAELAKESEKIDVLRHLLADKIIKPAMFVQDQNASNKRSDELRRQIAQLSQLDTGNAEKVAETEKLLHFLENAEMQTEFTDNLVTDFIEKIFVNDRHSVGIQLKCGLTLQEEL